MFEVRSDEPRYAFLWDQQTRDKNQYGHAVETVPSDHPLRQQPFIINQENQTQQNPNRYKQHGFYFNADNCIFCHACEAACSEKNDNPAHIAFRSVGFVESGSYPSYQRLNISMACNHCTDPVCLKGCPTRAYTKFAEYGAVLQDPETCFGCGYCTWVCPYNAPQLDPVQGQVSKCNMCVDRLEVGLKPACVAACLGNALDFGVIDNIPQGRTQAELSIPGFPRTDITQPNIRFQQTRPLQREVVRMDSMPIKYQQNEQGHYRSVVDKKQGLQRQWGLAKLLASHENAHALFTLSVQTVMGAWLLLLLGELPALPALHPIHQPAGLWPLLAVLLGLLSFGLVKLLLHLGKPHRFYRGFNNLRLSPVSREIAGVSAFFAGLAGYALFKLLQWPVLAYASAGLALLGMLTGGYYMYKLYRIPARPFWDHWQTATAFVGTGLSLGSLLLALVWTATTPEVPVSLLAGIASVGLGLQAVGLWFHARDLQRGEGEGQASHFVQTTAFGNSYWLRNGLLLLNLGVLLAIGVSGGLPSGWLGLILGLGLTLSLLTGAYLERILFYAIVIPTTMPGAFFWKNKGFVEHAREIGLAQRPSVGVVYERHHAFKWGELWQTVRTTPFKQMLLHVKWIVTG